MKHDYKAALESLDNRYETRDEWVMVEAVIGYENTNTIRHALLMMQKLGEPSEGMIVAEGLKDALQAIWDIVEGRPNIGKTRAMIWRDEALAAYGVLEQAEKEIEG